MAKIKSIHAFEIIDSNGYPTIEAELVLDNGLLVSTSIPSGLSVGKYEAVELRDNDPKRFNGLGVLTAVSYINDLLGPKLVGASPEKQADIDGWLIRSDGTKNKNRLGANTTLAISQLVAKAAAAASGIPLYIYLNQLYEKQYKTKIEIKRIPIPVFSIINGGKHSNNNLEFQEFQLIPSSSYSFNKSMQTCLEIFYQLKNVLEYRGANISVGNEGGFTPNLMTNADALEVIKETINQRNLRLGLDIFMGVDVAASYFFKDERYFIKDKSSPLKIDEYMDFINKLVTNYSILILEDPLNQDDWEYWNKLSKTISHEMYLAGDDLLSSNKDRLARAIKEKSCNTIVIKPNQLGTIIENLEVIDMARRNNFSYIVSQRSAETNDTFLADFSVAVQADFVKFGALSRGERVAKYNRLWRIEKEELKIVDS